MGTMLVRVFYDGSDIGHVTTWNDIWSISAAMEYWLNGTERFELLGYYPTYEGSSGYLVTAFQEAERRHASCSSD